MRPVSEESSCPADAAVIAVGGTCVASKARDSVDPDRLVGRGEDRSCYANTWRAARR